MVIVVNSRFLTQRLTGVQRYATEISLNLKKMVNQVEFIAPNDVIQEKYFKLLNANSNGTLKGHLWEQAELPGLLNKKNSPLLINLGNTAPVFYKNKITTIHDLSFMRNPEWYSKKFYYLYKSLIPAIARNSLKVITVSEFSKQEIIDLIKIPEDKVEVVYNAVSGEFMKLASENTYENKYGSYILAVSSLDPRKNFKNLILAFNQLNVKDTKLVIVGSENKIFSDNELKELVESNNNIIFTGYVNDNELVGLYKNAELFVYPSLYEGFGIPPLEAMACGCPVIAAKSSSLPEVCKDAALFVDPFDINDISENIKELLTNVTMQKELVRNGKVRVKNFSWEKSAQAFLDTVSEFVQI